MKLYLLVALVTFASASPLLGSKKCSWGPSYWCSHISSAKECRAMGHCMQTVWKNQIVKPEASEPCSICELVINDIRGKLKDKATEEKIGSLIAEACVLFPGDSMKKKCKTLVTDYLPEVIQLLQSELDATVVCAAMGFCTGVEDLPRQNVNNAVAVVNTLPVFMKPKPVPKASKICTDCKTFMGDIDAILSDNSTVQQLEDMLDQMVCSQLGAFQTMCRQYMNQLVPQALDFLAQQFDPQMVCIMMGFCSNTGQEETIAAFKARMVEALMKLKKTGAGGEKCDLCKMAVTEVRDFARDATSQKMVIDFIENNVCSLLGVNSSLAAECKALVEQYGPMIFGLIVSEMDPDALCTQLGLCNSTRSAILLKPAKVAPSVQKVTGELCSVCEIVVQEVDALLEQHYSKVEIESALHLMCDKLPDTLKDECHTIVDKYTPKIVEYLINELDPAKICSMLGLCPAKSSNDAKVSAGPLCVLCEFVINKLESMINKTSTRKQVEQALEKVCQILPTTISAECKSFVLQYEPAILNLLMKEFSPEEVCRLLFLCTSVQVPVAAPPLCIICEFAMKYIVDYLKGNRTEEAIMQALERVCDILPKTVRDECTAFVEQYGPAIINLLEQELDPEQVCTVLGLCSQSVSGSQRSKDLIIGTSAECEICEFFMKELDSILSKNATQEEITSALFQVCDRLPQTVRQDCKSFVDKYSAMVIQLLLESLEPKSICAALGRCKSTQSPPPEEVKSHVQPLSSILIQGAPVPGAATNEECLVCQMIVNYIAMGLKENATVQDIIKAMKNACGMLPGELNSLCTNLVDRYGEDIAKLLAQSMDPKQICEDLKLCLNNNVLPSKPNPKPIKPASEENNTMYFKSKLLGTKECTYGPDYWCANEENARRCKAMEHCRKHVWKIPK